MKFILAKLNDGNNQLSNQWYVYYSYKHPETGKMFTFRKWISNRVKTKAGRRDKARELIDIINTRLRRGWNPFSDHDIKLTNISDAIDFAMRIKSATIKKRSQHTYNSVVKNFTEYLKKADIQKMPVNEINLQIVQDYFDNMLLNEKISKRTYNNRLTPLKTIFTLLQKREYINYNPFLGIDKLKVNEPEIAAYTNNELEEMGKSLPKYNYNLYAITQLIFYCFIRPAEIVRLQFKDIMWEHGIIVLPGTKSKNKKSEVMIIPDQLKLNLADWNLNYPADSYIFSRDLKPGTKEVAPTRIAGAWREYAKANNIKKNIYDFKHTGNGFAFDQGFNSRDIQLQNRHSSLDETQRYLNKFRRVASDKFREEFKGY
ncbi:MAG: site-specific integrase [Bacteroidetes bacterium]|nr:site-specific integrase [Bacteroidota bacterium]